jgi:hypothetical protein
VKIKEKFTSSAFQFKKKDGYAKEDEKENSGTR